MLHMHTVAIYQNDIIHQCSWLQQDPGEILKSVKDCIEDVCKQCREKNIGLTAIKGMFITYGAAVSLRARIPQSIVCI